MVKNKTKLIAIIVMVTMLNVVLTILLSNLSSRHDDNYIYVVGERANAINNEETAIAFARLLFLEHVEYIIGMGSTVNPLDIIFMQEEPLSAVLIDGVWKVFQTAAFDIDRFGIILYAEFYQSDGRIMKIGFR